MFVEIPDPEKIQELRLAGLVWYAWGDGGRKIPLAAENAAGDSLASVRSFIRGGFRYYVLLED